MKKQPAVKSTVAGITPVVMPYADILALKQPERIARFGERATVAQRAFAEMGKLRRAIEASLKPTEFITHVLRKVGVRDGTISNTSYAAKVFDLVESKHLTEAQYDGFTFADCLAISRAMSPISKKRLHAADVADIITLFPNTYDEELVSIASFGVNIAEHAAQEKKEADALAAAEQKKKDDAVATEVARIEAEKKLAPAPTGPNVVTPPDSQVAATPPAAGPAPVIVDAAAESTETPVQTSETETPNIVDSGIPEKTGRSKASQALSLVDALELLLAEMSIEDARKVAPRLVELTDTVMQYCASTAEEQAEAVEKIAA